MLDVLLVRIQPMQQEYYVKSEVFEYFNKETLNFKISVVNGDSLHFKASKESYSFPSRSETVKSFFYEKVREINEEIDVADGGHIIAIDKYPRSQFVFGAEKDEKLTHELRRWKVECQSEHFDYDSVILLIPGMEPTVLSTLKFACNRLKGFYYSFIAFEQKVILSLTSPFGEVIGKILPDQNETGLMFPRYDWFYAMSFEKVSLPAVILQKLLEIKPQSGSEPHEETHE